jgi:hypothetical protein
MHQFTRRHTRIFGLLAAFAVALLVVAAHAQDTRPPVKVKIQDETPVVAADAEDTAPVDPTNHVQLQNQGNMALTVRVDNQTMHLGAIGTTFKIDNQVVFPNIIQGFGGRNNVFNQPLPKGKSGKMRIGSRTVFEHGKIRITQESEIVATKAKPGQKRRLDAVLVQQFIENSDTRPHSVGARIFMDVFIVDNDGALFAAPTQPGKVLDGVELKGKTLPDYVQFLQRPDIKNPGFIAHLTLNFGRSIDMADRVILTGLGAQQDGWNVGVQQAMGDSAMAVFWDPREIKPGTKRHIAWGYGQGIAPAPEPEGRVNLNLAGSFEPGKLFSVTAQVQDPAQGQTLALELPPGMALVEGKERQPVPALADDGSAMVMWKARVLQTGQHTLRVRSSTGTAQGKLITISRPE